MWTTSKGSLEVTKNAVKLSEFKTNIEELYVSSDGLSTTLRVLDSWACCVCTFGNHNTRVCALCGVKVCELCFRNFSNSETAVDTASKTVNCPVCTYANNKAVNVCEMCGQRLKSSTFSEIKFEFLNETDQLSFFKAINHETEAAHGLNKLRAKRSIDQAKRLKLVKSTTNFTKFAENCKELSQIALNLHIAPHLSPSVQTQLQEVFIDSDLLETRGALTLHEAYAIFNRQRALNLLSPAEFVRELEAKPNLRVRTLLNGGQIVELPNFEVRLTMRVDNTSAEELARATGLSVQLVLDEMLRREKQGKLVRDESVHGLKFFQNTCFL